MSTPLSHFLHNAFFFRERGAGQSPESREYPRPKKWLKRMHLFSLGLESSSRMKREGGKENTPFVSSFSSLSDGQHWPEDNNTPLRAICVILTAGLGHAKREYSLLDSNKKKEITQKCTHIYKDNGQSAVIIHIPQKFIGEKTRISNESGRTDLRQIDRICCPLKNLLAARWRTY